MTQEGTKGRSSYSPGAKKARRAKARLRIKTLRPSGERGASGCAAPGRSVRRLQPGAVFVGGAPRAPRHRLHLGRTGVLRTEAAQRMAATHLGEHPAADHKALKGHSHAELLRQPVHHITKEHAVERRQISPGKA